MFSSRKSCLLPPAFSILNLFLKSYIKTQESFPSAFVSSALEMGSFCSKAIYNPELRKTLLCTTTWFKQHPLKPTKSTFKSQIPFLSKRTRKKKKRGKNALPSHPGSEFTASAQLCLLHFALRRAGIPGCSLWASAVQPDGLPSTGADSTARQPWNEGGGRSPAQRGSTCALHMFSPTQSEFALLSSKRKQKHCYTRSANIYI